MDHNNKHLLPGFQFPSAFAGLPNLAQNQNASLLSALSHLSIPTAILPTSLNLNPTEFAQWAAAQQTNQQSWLDQQKLAAMLPSLYLSSVSSVDVKNLALAQQTLQNSVVNGSSSSNIFPNLTLKQLPTPTPKLLSQPIVESAESPISGEPLSNASSSHNSTSTPQEIDVGTIAPYSQTLDLSTSSNSPVNNTVPSVAAAPQKNGHSAPVCEPSTSTSTTTAPKTISKTTNRVMTNTELAKLDADQLVGSLFERRREAPKRSQSEMIIPIAQSLVAGVPPPSAPPIKRSAQQGEEDGEDHVLDGFLNDFANPAEHDDHGAAAATFGLFGESINDGGLSPVQFTPPDSPDNRGHHEPRPTPAATPVVQTNGPPPPPCPTPAISVPSTSKTPPIKKPVPIVAHKVEPFKAPVTSVTSVKKQPFQAKPVTKAKNVPIYKQKRLGLFTPDPVVAKDASGDAYSFDDEEDLPFVKPENAKDKLDQEVRDKLSKLASQPGGDKNKNVYVPGVGFAVPQEQAQQDPWRNVVLKKRPVENRPAVPSANLLPASVHAEASRLAEPEIVTLAESLRRRKKARYVCAFIKTEGLPPSDNICFKEEGASERFADYCQSVEVVPKLPKLVIKLPKKPDEQHEKKKKKKKRKREEDDSDWEGDKKNKKKHKSKRKKSERKDSGYEIRVIEQEGFVEDIKQEAPPTPSPPPQPVKEEPPVPMMMNRKKQIMQQWQEETNQQLALQAQQAKQAPVEVKKENGLPEPPAGLQYNGIDGDKPVIKKYPSDFNADAIKQRLSKFSQADGNITKGCFVINKSELFRDDCALWKVDNPNMLQKFPPKVDPTTKNVTYKSSSTYSGWCEQISSGYYKVAVRFIKQSRSESIVEPEVPLSDLFPAMTSEATDKNGIIIAEEEAKPDPNEHINILRDQRRMSLYILNKEIIEHALTLEHLQKLKDKSDWNFLKAFTDVDKINTDCISKLRTMTNINEEIEDVVKDYAKMVVIDTKNESSGWICLTCQACKSDKRPVEKVIQLLGRQGYDRETLQYADKIRKRPPEEDDLYSQEPPLISTELYLCDQCAAAAQQFHRCYHMSFDLLRHSEDKLESLGTLHSDYKPEVIVEMAKKSRTWQNKIFTDIIEMWKKVETANPTLTTASVHPLTT